jgi:hypothetical protein
MTRKQLRIEANPRSFCHMKEVSRRTFIRRQTAASDSLTVTGMTVSLHHPIRVLEADRFHDGILIRFADGTTVLYTPEFLYEHRGASGNREVADEPAA